MPAKKTFMLAEDEDGTLHMASIGDSRLLPGNEWKALGTGTYHATTGVFVSHAGERYWVTSGWVLSRWI